MKKFLVILVYESWYGNEDPEVRTTIIGKVKASNEEKAKEIMSKYDINEYIPICPVVNNTFSNFKFIELSSLKEFNGEDHE